MSALNYDPDILSTNYLNLSALIKEVPLHNNALANMVLSHETQNKFGSIEGLIPALIKNLQAGITIKAMGTIWLQEAFTN